MANGPVGNIATLSLVSSAAASQIINAAKAGGSAEAIAAAAAPRAAATIKPGVERWPVKTGTDDDHTLVGTNVLDGNNLGVGAVKTTVEELLTFKRPTNMPAVTSQFATTSVYQNRRAKPTEVTIWEITATVKEAKLENDGDYHLVLVGSSGKTLIGEIPNPKAKFVKNHEWLTAIQAARTAFDEHHGSPLPAVDFDPSTMAPPSVDRFAEGEAESEAAAMTPINARARIRGVGFFDSNHGQTGVATATAIELHPILLIEFS